MLLPRNLTALAFIAVGGLPALAETSGTQAQQEACTPDVFRLCEEFVPDEAPIVACLKRQRRLLSPACARVFYTKGSGRGEGRRSRNR